ncbi:MAG: acyl-CoA dehydrogenase family protein [Gammaproteobacteria bacterium]|nr:acyl-CoA dehydrogenase family protein [Gammaproteobacteria bacterium]
MDALNCFDLFDVESQLTDEERLVRDTVRRFVDSEVLPIIGRCFAEHRFPAELVPQLAELGLLGSTLREYGGAGLGSVAYGLICQELERGDGGLRSFVSVQSSLAIGAIDRFGSDEQRERWLPALARGQAIGCFALTEPQGGSDPGSMRTRAEPDGGDFVLRGSKIWITSGSIADVAVVWAATADGIGGFLVERDMPGFESRDIERKMSMRASVTSELYFDGVRVPRRNRLPGAAGLRAPLSLLSDARFGIVWGVLGAARACFEEALEFTQSRLLFGRPLAHTQAVQLRLADIARRLTTAQLLALRLGRLKEEGRVHPTQISLAKWNNVRMAIDVARDCRDLLGAAGVVTEHCAIRHMLNLESVITYEGTETVHELVVGKELTGTAAF